MINYWDKHTFNVCHPEMLTNLMPLHVSSTRAHYQEVKIALNSLCYHHTCRWPSRAQVERGLQLPNVTQLCLATYGPYSQVLSVWLQTGKELCFFNLHFGSNSHLSIQPLLHNLSCQSLQAQWLLYAPPAVALKNWLSSSKIFLCMLYLLTYLLTYSMVPSQEIPRISRNPKVHHRTHNRPSTVSILGQSNPVHIPTSYLLEIRPNITHPSTPRSPQWSPSLRFPHQDPIHPLSSPTRATHDTLCKIHQFKSSINFRLRRYIAEDSTTHKEL